MNNKIRVHDADSASGSGSDISNLSALDENETDDFGRRILEDQRARQLAKRENRPFWRAKPRPRTATAVESAIAVEAAEAAIAGPTTLQAGHHRAASAGSSHSDPPLNVPREWGRRAKRHADWARRLDTHEQRRDPAATPPTADEEDSIFPHRTLYTGDDNPLLSPGAVLAAIGTTPPSTHRRRQAASLSSLHHMHTTLQPALKPEDMDFNDASLLASTPAVNHRNRKIDMLMQQDMEMAEKPAATRRSLETLFGQVAGDGRPASAPSGDQSSIPAARRSDMGDKAHEPGDAGISKDAGQLPRQARPAQHARNDSLVLLRKLARVSSLSPSPARHQPDERRAGGSAPSAADLTRHAEPQSGGGPLDGRRVRIDDNAKKDDGVAERDVAVQNTKLREATAATKDPRRILSEPIHPRSALEAIVQEAKEKGDPLLGENTLASLEDIVHPPDAASSPSNLDAHGHPGPAENEYATSRPLTQAETDRRHEDIALEHPNRRLHPSGPAENEYTTSAPLRQAEADRRHEDLALEHLDRRLHSSGPAENEHATSLPLTQAEKDRRQEDLALENLNRRLRSTRSTIKDANRGLRRIENRIEAASDHDAEPSREPEIGSEAWARSLPPYTNHNGRTLCAHCGGSYTSVWRGLWTEFRENFYVWEGPKQQDLRITWLGWTIIGWWAWYILESTASSYFARRYNAYFPFVIPTLTLRPLEPLWRPVLNFFVWGWRAVFGRPRHRDGWRQRPTKINPPVGRPKVGGQEWVGTVAKATATAATRIVSSAKQAVDDVGSMWDDEVL